MGCARDAASSGARAGARVTRAESMTAKRKAGRAWAWVARGAARANLHLGAGLTAACPAPNPEGRAPRGGRLSAPRDDVRPSHPGRAAPCHRSTCMAAVRPADRVRARLRSTQSSPARSRASQAAEAASCGSDRDGALSVLACLVVGLQHAQQVRQAAALAEAEHAVERAWHGGERCGGIRAQRGRARGAEEASRRAEAGAVRRAGAESHLPAA